MRKENKNPMKTVYFKKGKRCCVTIQQPQRLGVSDSTLQQSYSYGHSPSFTTWVFPKMVVPPNHHKMIIFGRKTHGFVGETHHLRKHPHQSRGIQRHNLKMLGHIRLLHFDGVSCDCWQECMDKQHWWHH